MKKKLLLLVVLLGGLVACTATDDTTSEYDNWEARNNAAFVDTLRRANAAIAEAKSRYGSAWETHCPWRTFRSYTLTETATATWKDSIAVRVLKNGTGSGVPLYTDTIRVNYVGRLMPTEQHPDGRVFDHSGLSARTDEAFREGLSQTAKFPVSGVVKGCTTAFQYMHVGDCWRMFLPAAMAYGATSTSKIPAQSMLIFDYRLTAYWRAGAVAP